MKKSEIRQNLILKYMKKVILEKGFPPTIREICQDLDIKSTSTVHKDIEALELKNLVTKDPSKPRTVYPTEMFPIHSGHLGKSNIKASFPSQDDIINNSEMVNLPVVGRVAAGTPILAEENIDDVIPMPARFISPGNNFILTVHGDSMINVGINDGDYLIVQECKDVRNGEIVVAMVDNDYESESTVKRFYKEDGHIRLQPENDTMDPIIVDNCTVLGRVKGVFRYFS